MPLGCPLGISLEETSSHLPLVPYFILTLGVLGFPSHTQTRIVGPVGLQCILVNKSPTLGYEESQMGLGVGGGSRHVHIASVGFCAQTWV